MPKVEKHEDTEYSLLRSSLPAAGGAIGDQGYGGSGKTIDRIQNQNLRILADEVLCRYAAYCLPNSVYFLPRKFWYSTILASTCTALSGFS